MDIFVGQDPKVLVRIVDHPGGNLWVDMKQTVMHPRFYNRWKKGHLLGAMARAGVASSDWDASPSTPRGDTVRMRLTPIDDSSPFIRTLRSIEKGDAIERNAFVDAIRDELALTIRPGLKSGGGDDPGSAADAVASRPAFDLIRVDFDGDEIWAVQDGPDVWVVLKRLCENLGMAGVQEQVEKVTSDGAMTHKLMLVRGSDGRPRPTFCIHLESLAGWLFSVSTAKVADAVKPALIRYKQRCHRRLTEVFFPQLGRDSDAPGIVDPHVKALVLALTKSDRAEQLASQAKTVAQAAISAVDDERACRAKDTEAIRAELGSLAERLERVSRVRIGYVSCNVVAQEIGLIYERGGPAGKAVKFMVMAAYPSARAEWVESRKDFAIRKEEAARFIREYRDILLREPAVAVHYSGETHVAFTSYFSGSEETVAKKRILARQFIAKAKERAVNLLHSLKASGTAQPVFWGFSDIISDPLERTVYQPLFPSQHGMANH